MEINYNKNSHNTMMAEVRDVMGVSLGIKGRGVLLHQKSPKQLTITKSGQDIMKVFADSHPFNKIIINSIQAMADVTGEGSKRTLLITTEFLHILENRLNVRANTFGRASAVRQLEKLKQMYRERDIFSESNGLMKKTVVNRISMLLEKFEDVLASCLRTRFNPSIANILQKVLTLFIEQSTRDCVSVHQFVKKIEDMSRRFPKYVTEVYNMPVSDSRVEDGLLIGSPIIGARRGGKVIGRGGDVRFVVVAEEDFYETGYTIRMNKGQDQVATGISYDGWRRSQVIQEQLVKSSVQLVISPKEVPAVVKSALRMAEVALIEFADKEELEDLCEESGVVAWCLGDQLNNVNVGVAEGVEAVQLGSQLGTKVRLQGARCQLVLSAPQKNLVGQYSRAVWGSVKAAKQLWTGNNWDNRREDKQIKLNNEKGNMEDEKINNECSESVGIIIKWVEGPAGLLILFSNWIKGALRVEKDCIDVLQCLTDSFQSVIRQLIINEDGKDRAPGKLDKLLLKNNVDDTGEPVVEPVEVGMEMIGCVLDIAIAIVRIERICSSRVRIKAITNTRNKVEMSHGKSDIDSDSD